MNLIPAYPAPDFMEIARWSDGLKHTIKEYKGKTILLDFWTYTCIFCLRTIPTIKEIEKKYKEDGLVVVSIHSSEYDFAKDIVNIEKAISLYNLKDYTTGFDTKNKTWEAYGNSYWPKHILIDKQGFIRYEHPGYGTENDFEEALLELLEISADAKKGKEDVDVKNENNVNPNVQDKNGMDYDGKEIGKIYGMHFAGMAPEICVGFSRLRRFGNNQKLRVNEYNILVEPATILENNVYLRGKWKWDREGIQANLDYKEKDPAIIFRYNSASNVNVICGSSDSKPAMAEIKLDGNYLNPDQAGYHSKTDNGMSFIETTWPFIQNIVKTKGNEIHKVEIIPRTDNFYFYTFIFG
jgi:thiol-disulfide isomerase/thioredoxin